jgi:cytochrome P450
VPTFAFPIPFLVICELLGLPDEDRETFRQLGSARFDVSSGGTGVFGAVSDSRKFLMEATRKQRTEPGEGLIGQIIREHGDEISDFDLGGLADGVFTGGLETSASMLALGTAVLLDHPDDYARVAEDPSAVNRTVEELLRYLTVVQIAFPRFPKHDVELAGHAIKKGDVIICQLAGANRDGRLGQMMDAFDPSRPVTPHLAFGHGFHRCVGAELARMELRAAFPALARRFPELSVATDKLTYRELSIVYGVESVPVRLGQ